MGREPIGNLRVGNRFGKEQRLLSSRDFGRVFNQPEHRVSVRQVLILASTNTLSHARLGLVVSRKNVGCAVARNRIKRLAREAFRHRQHSLGGLDLVLLARPGISAMENHAILDTLDELLAALANKTTGKPGS